MKSKGRGKVLYNPITKDNYSFINKGDETYMYNFAAMFALSGMLANPENYLNRTSTHYQAELERLVAISYDLADHMLDRMDVEFEEDEVEDTTGIAAIKPKKKYERKS